MRIRQSRIEQQSGMTIRIVQPEKKQKMKRIGRMLGLLLLTDLILNLVFYTECIRSMKQFWNALSMRLGQISGQIMPTYAIREEDKILSEIPFFYITVFLAVLMILWFILYFENRTAALVMAVIVSLFQGCAGNSWTMFFAGILLLLLFQAGEGHVKPGYTVAVSVLCLLILGPIAVSGNNGWLMTLHDKALNLIESMRYGTNDVMARRENGETALEVRMTAPDSYYLRGFVGSNLTKQSWQESNREVRYESADLFYWLHEDGFYGQSQLADMAACVNTSSKPEGQLRQNEMQIKNIDASRKYVYAPYEYLSDEMDLSRKNQIGDEALVSKEFGGMKEYRFTTTENLVSGYPKLLARLQQIKAGGQQKKYITDEVSYRDYVYGNYTELSDENQGILAGHLDGASENENGHGSCQKIKEALLNYLTAEISYQKEEGVDKNSHFLRNFLEEEHRGNDTDYATATVLMFRYYGVPARYVEGYLITPDDVAGVESGKSIQIPQSNAHAWAEYYQDGAGWIPFETTPAYLGIMKEASGVSVDTPSDAFSEMKSQKITADNYEKAPEKADETKEASSYKNLVKAVLQILLFVSVTSYLAAFLLIKKYRRRKLREATDTQAVLMMFESLMQLLFVFKIPRENKPLTQYREELVPYEADGWEVKGEQMIELYQKARYSGKPCSLDEREKMRQYLLLMKRQLYQTLKWYEKLRWNLIRMID